MSDQPQKFTQDARRVLSLAQEEAEQQDHKSIDTKHLLLGLLREEQGVAGEVLRALGLDVRQVEALLRKTRSTLPGAKEAAADVPLQPLLIFDENGNVLISNQPA